MKLFFAFFLLFSGLFAETFKVSYDPDYAPFSAGKRAPYGLLIDVWKLWAKENHHKVIFVPGKNWDDAIALARNGQVDFFIGTTPYASWMHASKAYYKTKTGLFVRKSYHGSISRIGIVGDDYEEDVRHRFPAAQIVSYADYAALMRALLTKKVTAVYDDSIALQLFATRKDILHRIEKYGGISAVSEIRAISNDAAKVKRFDEGFAKLSKDQLKQIEKVWVYDSAERYYDHKTFYADTVVTYVFDPDWKPFEYKDKMTQAHLGIIADILGVISEKTGMTFKPIPTKSWKESVALVRSGKADMFGAVPYTKERAAYLNLTTHDLFTYPAVLLAQKDTMPFSSKHKKSRIGIIKGNSLGAWVKQHYPSMRYRAYVSMEEAIAALQKKEIDYFAINGVTAAYEINILKHHTLAVNTKLPYKFHLKIALRKSIDPGILSAIDNAIGTIPKRTLNDIYHKWTTVTVKKETDYQTILLTIAFFLLIILIFSVVNRRLKRLIEDKTHEIRQLNKSLEQKVLDRTEALREVNRKMHANIEYASLIQHRILATPETLHQYFDDAFVIWKPKDTVGGDIYLVDEISPQECLIYLIDCTGHGVSGAFVTMLVKALKEQVSAMPTEKRTSPSCVLGYLNRSFKALLNLEHAKLNVGFDAAVLYYHKQEKRICYSGANMPLYLIEEGRVSTVKPDRYSVGYRKCAYDYHYQEHHIVVKSGMHLYMTTDGFVDQIGGEKGFSFGKNRLKKLLVRYEQHPLLIQKIRLMDALSEYQGEYEQTDDITMIGLKL